MIAGVVGASAVLAYWIFLSTSLPMVTESLALGALVIRSGGEVFDGFQLASLNQYAMFQGVVSSCLISEGDNDG